MTRTDSETYLYLAEMHRALKPGGRAVFSFIEFAEPSHWGTFEHTVEAQRQSVTPHLNMFIERPAISVWADRLGFKSVEFVDSNDGNKWNGGHLGQSLAILTKP